MATIVSSRGSTKMKQQHGLVVVANSYQQSLLSCCQMAERALSLELLCSAGGRSVSYLLHLAQLQLLRADYCSAAASLKEALFHRDQVLTLFTSGCNTE